MLQTVYSDEKGVIRLKKNEKITAEVVVSKREEIKEFIHKGFLIKCSVLQEENSLDVSVTIDKVPNSKQEEYAWVGFRYFVLPDFHRYYQLKEESINNHTYDKYEKLTNKGTNTEVECVYIHSETELPLTLHKTYVLTQPLLEKVELHALVEIQEEKKRLAMEIGSDENKKTYFITYESKKVSKRIEELCEVVLEVWEDFYQMKVKISPQTKRKLSLLEGVKSISEPSKGELF